MTNWRIIKKDGRGYQIINEKEFQIDWVFPEELWKFELVNPEDDFGKEE